MDPREGQNRARIPRKPGEPGVSWGAVGRGVSISRAASLSFLVLGLGAFLPAGCGGRRPFLTPPTSPHAGRPAPQARAPEEPSPRPGIEASPLNEFPPSYGAHRPAGAHLCRGGLPAEAVWEGHAEIRAGLAKGMDCVAGDFDGNGTRDFALLLKGWREDGRAVGGSGVVVLFYGPEGWLRAARLPGKVSLFNFELYGPRANPGEFGEPATPHHGLIDGGEGGMTKVFLYKDGAWQVSEHLSEWE